MIATGVLVGALGVAVAVSAAWSDGRAGSAQVTPLPSRLAFTVGRYYSGCDPDACFEAFIDTVDLRGGQPRTLVRGGGEDIAADPAFSNQGDQLAYDTDPAASKSTIMLASGDGSSARELAAGHSPAWSPDDSMLAFARIEREKPRSRRYVSRIYTIPSTGGPARRLTRGDEPGWSPTGEIAFERSGREGARIAVIPATGGSVRYLANGYSPTWSPDGSQIAFEGRRSIYIMSSQGTGVRRLCRGEDPAWSPDGNQIAFTLNGSSVALINVDGSQRRTLVRAKRLKRRRSDDMYVAAPAWGRWLSPAALQSGGRPRRHDLGRPVRAG